MDQRKRNKRLGALILLSILALSGAVAALIVVKMWDPKDYYHVRFRESVSGLEIGTTVRMRGVRVGQIRRIGIGRDVNVIVTLALEPGTPVTVDTRAILTSIGVTGLKFVELTGGNARSARIEPNTRRSIIKAGPSTFGALMNQADVIAAKAKVLSENMEKLASKRTVASVGRLRRNAAILADTLHHIDVDNRKQLKRIFKNVDRATLMMEQASTSLRALKKDLDERIPQTRKDAADAARSFERLTAKIRPEPAQRAVERAVAATRRRASDPSIERAARSLEIAARRLGDVSEELGKSLDFRSRQWDQIKKKLRKAGFFLRELGRKFGQ
jgi:phospholipid/cholesterol/gamma-HCH transport system substrate-binding protein